MLFIEYPKCSTCKKAKKWLDNKNVDYTDRDIKLNNPTFIELKQWLIDGNIDIKKMFNTSGLLYKELNLKEKMDELSLDEKLQILSTNGMLVKRPILINNDKIVFGFNPDQWEEVIK